MGVFDDLNRPPVLTVTADGDVSLREDVMERAVQLFRRCIIRAGEGLVMIGRCDTCQHWGEEGERLSRESRRHCVSPALLKGYHIELEEIPEAGILVEDDEGWAMMTGPRFGCSNHTPE